MRREWKFQYGAGAVADAAQQRAEYHRSRQAFWDGERDKAEADLRETGLEFRPMPVTDGERIDAVVDPHKSRRVEECRNKVIDHRTRAEQYEMWQRTLAGRDVTLDLDADDIEYFGLTATATADEREGS